MKKKISVILMFVVATLCLCFGLAACATKVENVNLGFVVDGQTISTITTSGKEVVAIPNNPEKEGYTFDGWYWDNGVWNNPFTANSLLNAPISSDMNVYAHFNTIEYTITYTLDGGTNTNPSTYNIETPTITLADSVKVGYSFDGWYKESSFNNKVTSIAQGSLGNIELYAKFTINQYTISFNADGGNEVEAITQDYNTAVSAPSEPTKAGYTFGGWFNGESQVAYEFTTMPAENISLKAKWTPIEYAISYDLVGGMNGDNPAKYTIETETITLADATKAGYTFDGWFSGNDKIESIDKGSIGNVDLQAHWTPIEYTITYNNTKSADNSNPTKYTIESETITLVNLEKLGYTFNGWYNGTEKVTSINKGSMGNLTLTADWTVNGYEITYHNVDGATNSNPDVYDVEDEPLTLVNASRAGYTFLGWYTDAEFNNSISVIAVGTIGDKDLYAKWELIVYTITYINDDTQGELVTGDTLKTNYTVEDNFDFPILASKVTGYEFSGWYTEKVLGTGTKYTGISAGMTGDMTLYSQYAPAVYTITYHNIDGVTNTNATTYTIESEDFTITNLSKVGYTFEGWYSNNELTTAATTTIVKGSHGNLDLYAKWEKITYTLTYNLYGGSYASGSNPANYTIEDNITLINPTQAGKFFVGWYTLAENGDLVKQIAAGTTGNITLYARWLVFDSKGGTTISYTPDFSTSGITKPTDPTKDYYGFAGWYFDEQFTKEYDFNSLPTASSTLYAKWDATNYTITYVLYDGTNSVANPDTYTVEDSVTFADPSKTGHTFNGWYSNAQFTSALVTGIPVGSHGNITIYANFGINQYTISFNSNGGTSVDDITQNYATSVSAPASPAKNGYSFGGWYSDSALKTAYAFTTIPAANITLYAKWDLVTYNITYNLDGGTNASANSVTYTIESATLNLADPSKTGYTFIGWYTDSAYTNAISSISGGSYGNKELFAKWQIITYSITYSIPVGAENSNMTEYTVITPSTMLAAASMTGYTFNGWYSNSSYTEETTTIGGGSVGNITIYGKFTANKYDVWLDGNEQASCAVSFDLNGASGTAPATQNITESNTLVYPAIPTRSGYIFSGWYSNSECNGEPYDFSALVASNITLYAKWVSIGSANVININSTATVQLSGTAEKVYKFIPLVSGNVSITSTGSIDTLGSLYRGSTLLKMDDDSGVDSNFLIVYNVTAGEVYEIHVRGFSSSTNGSVTLTLTGVATIAQGGYAKAGNKSEATFGASFKLPVPEAEGNYKFLGWQDSNGIMYTDGQGNSVINWNKAENSVLYSKWEKMEYTVTFVTNGGSSVDSITLEYGSRLDLNQYVTTRNNYTFSGWYESASATEPYSAGTMPDHNITLYAKWTTFALGTIKYDEAKNAVSINDEITANLFNAICIDTNGNLATFSVTVSGTQSAGNTISVRLSAASNGKTKQITITGVKVYGMPTLTISNTTRDFVNIIGGLTAEWFGASGTDTFGNETSINVKVADGYIGGDIGSIIIESIDVAGNVTSQILDNIKLYDLPQINFNADKNAISVNDTINPILFNATAEDSFGESVEIVVTYKEEYSYTTQTTNNYNYFTANKTGTYYLYYKNGSSNARTYISVYCINNNSSVASESYYTNTSYSYRSFSVVQGYQYRVSTRAYSSSYACEFFMYLADSTSSSANRISLFEGKNMPINLRATDSKGNIKSIDLLVAVYGIPKFSEVTQIEFKETEEITVNKLGLTSEDTYGNNLDIELSIKNGVQIGGQIVTYECTAIDIAGNIAKKEIAVKIYGTPVLTYDKNGLSTTKDLTLDPNVTILYYLNYEGAPTCESQTLGVGDSLSYPQIPERSGYIFRGWFIDKECTHLYDFSATLVDSIKLYAGWVEAATSYRYLRTIDIVDNYNSSSKALHLGIGDSYSDKSYTYFRIYNDGLYTVYYKTSHTGYYSHSGGSRYIEIKNAVDNTTIKSSTSCNNTNYTSYSFNAKAGDVICLISYGSPCRFSGTGKSYCSPEVYILGGTAPQAGGVVSGSCTNHLKGLENIFNAVAVDSFGNNLDVTVSFKSGNVSVGETLIYVLSASDHLGNIVTIETKSLGIYDVSDIQFTYSNMASDIIKITSKGEEFFAAATDTFGNQCDITIVPADGYELRGGEIINLYIVATDKAGNSLSSELITGIKVYDRPTIYLVDEDKGYTVEEGTNISFLFKVLDSFGEEIYAELSAESQLLGGNYVNITVEAMDDSGNIVKQTYEVAVYSTDAPYVELYVDNVLWEEMFIEDKTNMILPIPTLANKGFYGWIDNEGVYYTLDDGIVIDELSGFNRLYAIFYPEGFTVITQASELNDISLDGNYILFNDLDFENVEWTPLGAFTGIFDGNGYSIKNLKITTSNSNKKVGLFESNSGTIKNLGVENIYINITISGSFNSATIGGIVASNSGSIYNCYSTGTITFKGEEHIYAGGIAGGTSGEIIQCYSSVEISVKGEYCYVGGLIGSKSSSAKTIEECYATGGITVNSKNYAYVGGLLGSNSGDINNCYATGNIEVNNSNTSSYSTGSISTLTYVGGLIGDNSSSSSSRYIVSNCYSSGNITFVGTVTNSGGKSYCTCYGGGLIGRNGSSNTIKNSYAVGNVSINATSSDGSIYGGGLIGKDGYVQNSYRSGSQTIKLTGNNQTTSTLGTSTTLVNIKSSSFQNETLGFDTLIWQIVDGAHPKFIWQD